MRLTERRVAEKHAEAAAMCLTEVCGTGLCGMGVCGTRMCSTEMSGTETDRSLTCVAETHTAKGRGDGRGEGESNLKRLGSFKVHFKIVNHTTGAHF
jgi:hypothetical protein